MADAEPQPLTEVTTIVTLPNGKQLRITVVVSPTWTPTLEPTCSPTWPSATLISRSRHPDGQLRAHGQGQG